MDDEERKLALEWLKSEENFNQAKKVFADNFMHYSYSNDRGDIQNSGDGTGYLELRNPNVMIRFEVWEIRKLLVELRLKERRSK